MIPESIIKDYNKLYELIEGLIDDNRPPTDPCQSVREALESLSEFKADAHEALQSIKADELDGHDFTYKILLAYLCRDLGSACLIHKEFADGEDLINECLELVEPWKKRAEAIIPYMGALNELGVMHVNLAQYKESVKYLKLGERAFNDFQKQEGVEAITIKDIFGGAVTDSGVKGPVELDKLYTYCSFYSAQVYGQLRGMKRYVKYCNMSLRRLMKIEPWESLYFVMHAGKLSKCYIAENRFKEARHHLAAATLIMAKPEAKMMRPEMPEEERKAISRLYKQYHGDLARRWVKYGLALLTVSKDRLSNDDKKTSAKGEQSVSVTNRLDNAFDCVYEKLITADYCLTFDDAKPVYRFVIEWLDKALTYYKPENEVLRNANIIMDYARLYQNMAFFENDHANQYKMQKRSAKYYEDLLKNIDSNHVGIRRECWHGAGISYSCILDIKLYDLHTHMTQRDMQTINYVCQKAINHFQDFVQSYMEEDDVTLQELRCEEARLLLYTYFNLAQLHHKTMTRDRSLRMEYFTNSMKYYKIFTEKYDALKGEGNDFEQELNISREMVQFLTFKIADFKVGFE